MSSAESNANGMLYCRADSCAFSSVRRDSAVTRHSCARAKPGMRRLTACNPNPRMPKRIKENHGVAGDSPAAFAFDFGLFLFPARVQCQSGFRGTYLAGDSPAPPQNKPNHT